MRTITSSSLSTNKQSFLSFTINPRPTKEVGYHPPDGVSPAATKQNKTKQNKKRQKTKKKKKKPQKKVGI